MKILIIRFSSLGDLVTLEPILRAVHYFFKGNQIDFLTTGVGEELYKDSGYFTEIYHHQGVLSSIGLLSDHYDVVLNLQCNKPSHVVALMTKKKQVINKSYNLWQKIFKIPTHSKNLEELLIEMGVNAYDLTHYLSDPQSSLISLTVPDVDSQPVVDTAKSIAISTGSSERWESKKWGVERYSSLIKQLINRGYHIILVGTDLEYDDAQIIEKDNPQVVNKVGKTALSELKVILSEVSLFIGNDSGPAHIAAGVGTHTITIFGSTGSQHCVSKMPYSAHHECIVPSKTIHCHPCYLSQCPTDHECMQSIGLNELLSCVESVSHLQ